MANKTIILTDEERREIYTSLSIRCGFIETGTINRAKDLGVLDKKKHIKVLSSDQMRFIVFLEDLMNKVLF